MKLPFAKFFGKPKRVVGIDVGTSSVKVVEIEKNQNINLLTNYAYFYNPDKESGFYFNSLKVDFDYITDVVSNLLNSAKIVPENVVMSIPVAASFSTIVTLPNMGEMNEMEAAIKFEANKLIPVPVDEVRLEWRVLNHLSDNQIINVLVIAIPNDIIGKYNNMAKLLGVKEMNFELESMSLGNLFALPDVSNVSGGGSQVRPETFIVVDMGQYHTSIVIVDKGVSCSHNISQISGMSFVDKIESMMSVSKDRADDIRKNQGLNSNSQIKECMTVMLDKLVGEIVKSGELYASHGGGRMQELVLSGGFAKTPKVDEYLSNALKIPSVIVSPFNKVSVDKTLLPVLNKQNVDLSVAVGLTI